MSNKFKIVVTGGSGRFGGLLKKSVGKNYFFPNKKKLNILNLNSTIKYLSKIKPRYLVHLAGLSRPLRLHDINIEQSIKLNIIGTSNITIACQKLNIKLIHFSTSYVYPGKKGNYKETDSLMPNNNYAWSKLGAESAVRMYKNSLILRVSMTEKPFIHKSAFANVKSNFIYHDEFIRIFLKIINKKGVINIGGKAQSIHKFVKKTNKKIKKIYSKGELPLKMDMKLNKLHKYIK